MTIYEFQILAFGEKEKAVRNDGIFLASYEEGDNRCDAYELFGFYVAFCFELHVNERIRITAHINPDELPYLFKLNKLT